MEEIVIQEMIIRTMYNNLGKRATYGDNVLQSGKPTFSRMLRQWELCRFVVTFFSESALQ